MVQWDPAGLAQSSLVPQGDGQVATPLLLHLHADSLDCLQANPTQHKGIAKVQQHSST